MQTPSDPTPSHLPRLQTTRTIYTAPPSSWLEALTLRPNGQAILTTRLDVPELWSLDPSTSDASSPATLLHAFPHATGLVGICRIRANANEEEYAVVAGRFTLKPVAIEAGSWCVWKAVLDAKSGAFVRAGVVARIPEAGLLNGVVAVPDAVGGTGQGRKGVLLVSDSVEGVVWQVDEGTGEYRVALADETMRPAEGAGSVFGVNGVRVVGSEVWYASTGRELLCRVPVAVDEEGNVTAKGPVEVVARGLAGADGLAVSTDGTAFVAGNRSGKVYRVGPGGGVEVLMEDDKRPTAVEFGTEPGANGGLVLWVSCGGGSSGDQVRGKVVSCELVGDYV